MMIFKAASASLRLARDARPRVWHAGDTGAGRTWEPKKLLTIKQAVTGTEDSRYAILL